MATEQTQEWLKKIDEVTGDFAKLTKGLTIEELNWRPNPQSWSIAQILDHIIRINRSYYPILDQLKAGSFKPPLHGRVGFIAGFFGDFIYKSIHPENRKKVKTFSIWEPGQSTIPAEITGRFATEQEALKSMILSCGELINRKPVIHSPASKIAVYTLDKAFDIIVTHESRHLLQAREVYDLLKKLD